MKIARVLILALAGAAAADAQNVNIVMKDGSVVATKEIVRRTGDLIMAKVERQMPPPAQGQAPVTPPVDEVGFAVQKIAKIEFPEPAQLKQSAALIGQGKIDEALSRLDSVFRYYEGFRDAPGSWWGEAAVLKVGALLTQGKDSDAASLVDQLNRFATEPQTALAGRALSAALMSRRGDHARAVEVFEAVMKDGSAPDVLAVAAIYKGRSHLALKQYDPAALSFLQIPVLYPEAKHLLPASTLGAGQAFAGLQDRARAKDVLTGLIKDFPSTSEAGQAREELAAIAKIEKALEDPK
jgi:tetratricopeptide (TPR) repeat protein